MTNQLPNGWTITDLPSVVFFQEGPGLRKFQYTDHGVPFLNIRTLVNERVDINLCGFLSEEEVNQKYKHFLLNDGDIICSTSGTIGKTAVIRSQDLPLMLNTSIIRFRSHNNDILADKIIYYFLRSNYFLVQADKNSTGTAQKNIGPSHLKEFIFPLPPRAEQKEIATLLDNLLAQVDTLKTRLDAIPNILKRFRQSVLAAAVSGKLTEEEDSHFLKKERAMTSLQEISSVVGGLTKNAKRSDFPIKKPYLRVANVYENEFKLDDVSEIGVEEKELQRILLKPNDLLIVEGNGSLEHIGRAALWKGEITDCVHQNHLIKIRVNESQQNANFILFYLMSPQGKTEIVSKATSGAGLYTLSISKVSSIQIPVFSLEEQTEIVRRVEELFAFADQIEQRVKIAQQRVNHLTQAILAKAFRGELTAEWREQNPELISGENSAAALLARIQASNSNNVKASRHSK